MSRVRVDEPAPGIAIAQPEVGHRYSSDAFWLAGFAIECSPDRTPVRVLDMGTGSGIIGALLAAEGMEVIGIDSMVEWQPLWAKTLAESRSVRTLTLQVGDVHNPPSGPFDLVVANPPFYPAGAGRVPGNPWRAAARTESSAPLAVWLEATRAVLTPSGSACFVLPSQRMDEALMDGFERVRCVQVGGKRTLVELKRGEGSAAEPEVVGAEGARVASWYRLVNAVNALERR